MASVGLGPVPWSSPWPWPYPVLAFPLSGHRPGLLSRKRWFPRREAVCGIRTGSPGPSEALMPPLQTPAWLVRHGDFGTEF